MQEGKFWRFLILISLAALIFSALVSGEMIKYINPSFIPAQCFTLVILVIFAAIQLVPAHELEKGVSPLVVIAFLTPILLAGLIPPITLGADAVKRQGLIDYSLVKTPSSTPNPSVTLEKITLTNENFIETLISLSQDPHKLAGTEIEMVGFVVKAQELLPDDQFFLARLVVTCHVAHAQPNGLIVSYAGADRLQSNQWVLVEGSVEVGLYQGRKVPTIQAENICEVEPLANPYVFLGH